VTTFVEEVVDVVDENGARIGTATRRDVHTSGAWHRGAHVLIFNSRGEVLLQRRSLRKDKSPGTLDLSVSEHSRAGESFGETAIRGLREELGIEGIPIEKVLKFRLVYGPADNMVSVLFRSDYAGKVRPDPSEVEEVVAMGAERLRRLTNDGAEKQLAPWARELLRWYLHLPSKLEEIG